MDISFFKVVKTNTKKERLEKLKKEKLLLIPENIGDSVLGVFKTKIPTEYREKGIMYFKDWIFQTNIFFNWLSILHIPFDKCNDFRHFYLTIIAELFRRPLLRNLTLITSHLTVL